MRDFLHKESPMRPYIDSAIVDVLYLHEMPIEGILCYLQERFPECDSLYEESAIKRLTRIMTTLSLDGDLHIYRDPEVSRNYGREDAPYAGEWSE